jgi:hypothetical protein
MYYYLLVLIFLAIGWTTANGESKTQFVRLLDVFIYGPLLIYIGFDKSNNLNEIIRIVLLLMGATTISYNARNFLTYI